MNAKPVYAISAAAALAFAASSSATEGITCPSSITVTPTILSVQPGWDFVAGGGERPLERVGVYLGDPADYGARVPDSTKRVERTENVSWHIVHTRADTYWVGCSYVGTTAMLFQKLDPAATRCVATYDLLPSGTRQRLSSLDCR